MTKRSYCLFATILTGFILLVTSARGWTAPPGAVDGSVLYSTHCAACHDGAVPRAPRLSVLREKSAEAILGALEAGPMKFIGLLRSLPERKALAEFVSGKKLGAEATETTVGGLCANAPGEFSDPTKGAQWNGWSTDLENSRFQSAEQAGLDAERVSHLKVKWAFALPPEAQASQPTIAGGRVFIGSMRGRIYSIDAATGCLYWSIATPAGVRSAVRIGQLPNTSPPRFVAYFGDIGAN